MERVPKRLWRPPKLLTLVGMDLCFYVCATFWLHRLNVAAEIVTHRDQAMLFPVFYYPILVSQWRLRALVPVQSWWECLPVWSSSSSAVVCLQNNPFETSDTTSTWWLVRGRLLDGIPPSLLLQHCCSFMLLYLSGSVKKQKSQPCDWLVSHLHRHAAE